MTNDIGAKVRAVAEAGARLGFWKVGEQDTNHWNYRITVTDQHGRAYWIMATGAPRRIAATSQHVGQGAMTQDAATERAACSADRDSSSIARELSRRCINNPVNAVAIDEARAKLGARQDTREQWRQAVKQMQRMGFTLPSQDQEDNGIPRRDIYSLHFYKTGCPRVTMTRPGRVTIEREPSTTPERLPQLLALLLDFDAE